MAVAFRNGVDLGMVTECASTKTNTPFQVGLAPMEGVTDFSARLWFALVSCPDFSWTPFLRITENFPTKRISPVWFPENASGASALSLRTIPQLMSSSADEICRIAEHLLNYTDFVDINCGCPAPTVVGSHAGSALLREKDCFLKFISCIESRLGKHRYSIKMRTGFTCHSEFSELLNCYSGMSPKQVTVHGRTREQRYTGHAKWELIAEAATRLTNPVIGSGDLVNSASLLNFKRIAPLVSGAIVGRGALRNPWIFTELKTGSAVCISARTIVSALATFALLHELEHAQPSSLVKWAMSNQFVQKKAAVPAEQDAWSDVYAQTVEEFRGIYIPPQDLEVAHATLCRVKLFWNYLRSSLPEPFFEPEVLRAKTLPALLTSILAIESKLGDEMKKFIVSHNPNHNWMYSGSKRDEPKTPGISDEAS